MPKRNRLDQPLYDSVRSLILTKLRNGEWSPGTKIPTEPELAKLFAVSVGTVRKAVEDLVIEQVLIRRARIGTTVATHEQHNQFSTFFNFTHQQQYDQILKPELLTFKKIAATSEIAKIFGLQKGDPFITIDNMRRIHDLSVMYDRIWLPQSKFPSLNQNSFENRSSSIYSLYQSQFLMTIVRISEQLEAIKVPEFVRTELHLKKTDPVLKITRRAYSYGDELVEYRHRYVNTSFSLYQNEIGLKE